MTDRNRLAAASRISRMRDRFEYRLVVALAFVLCLFATVLRRMAGSGSPAAAGHRQSVFAEAHSAAMAAVGYAFIA